ncbi:hypothetical protein D3C71_2103150 [compost metagenome]
MNIQLIRHATLWIKYAGRSYGFHQPLPCHKGRATDEALRETVARSCLYPGGW